MLFFVRIYIGIIFLISTVSLTAGSKKIEFGSFGLGFNSTDVLVAKRTSYDVFNDLKKISGDSVSIQFEMKFIDISYFGYVLNLDWTTGEEINLVLVNFRENGKLHLDCNILPQGSKITIPIINTEQERGHWYKIALLIDYKKEQICMSVDNQKLFINHLKLPPKTHLRSVFGMSSKYTDVPKIAIRNVNFFDGKEVHFFPLNESEGEVVCNSKGEKIGKVLNPDWIKRHHYHWKKMFEFNTKEVSGVSLDKRDGTILIYNSREIIRFLPSKNDTVRIPNRNKTKLSIVSGGALFRDTGDSLLVYNLSNKIGNSCNFANYNLKTGQLTPISNAKLNSELHHSNFFLRKDSDRPIVFGGYGNFSYSGKFYQLNDSLSKWELLSFRGDTICPRFFAALVTDYTQENDLAYIFGGFGNRTGKQEDGGKYYYDLYKVDFRKKRIDKLCEFTLPDSLQVIPASNMIYDSTSDLFWAFCYNKDLPKTVGHIYCFDKNGKTFERISDGVNLISERIKTKVYLFRDELSQQLYCVLHEFDPDKGVNITVYSLSWPPILNNVPSKFVSHTKGWVIGSLLAAILAVAAVFVIWKKKIRFKYRMHRKVSVQKTNLPDTPVLQEPTINTQNWILLLGKFYVSDRNGNDITFRFSKKIRQIFFLILLTSQSKREGISSEELSFIIWPEKEVSLTKNTRGVTIKNLRSVLADMDGVTLIYEKSKWRIHIDSKLCYCDYLQVMALTNEELMANIHTYLDLFHEGTLLSSYSYQWLDSYKLNFEDHTMSLLLPLLSELYRRNDFARTLKVASYILSIDPLNEEVFKIEISTLVLIGKQDTAKLKFQIFSKEYFSSYGKELSEKKFFG